MRSLFKGERKAMFNPQKLLEQFLGGGSGDGKREGVSPDLLKGLAGGAAAGGLAGLLLGGKGTQKLATTALKFGGTAVLGGLAYKAYQTWQANKSDAAQASPQMQDITPPPEGTPFLPSAQAERDALSLAVLRAMITAAKADGNIDGAEQQRIFGKLDDLGLDAEAKAFIVDEFRKPLNIDAVVADATSPERAAELYAASLIAIDPDDPAEQAYLTMLAARLKIEPGLKLSIETEAKHALSVPA
jgi:uncharacterized membrane protein YebE (DUF533 family)